MLFPSIQYLYYVFYFCKHFNNHATIKRFCEKPICYCMFAWNSTDANNFFCLYYLEVLTTYLSLVILWFTFLETCELLFPITIWNRKKKKTKPQSKTGVDLKSGSMQSLARNIAWFGWSMDYSLNLSSCAPITWNGAWVIVITPINHHFKWSGLLWKPGVKLWTRRNYC